MTSTAPKWDRADLIRRLVRTLKLAGRVVELVRPDQGPSQPADRAVTGSDIPGSKAVAEAAMLSYAAAAVRDRSGAIAEAMDDLTRRLVPHARAQSVIAALCLDPAQARHHATVHILLSQLGRTDDVLDGLLRQSIATARNCGPERLPYRELEQNWLAALWPVGQLNCVAADALLLGRSSLGRPLDTLGATPLDTYAFTHTVLYASDFGRRPVTLPRPAADIVADVEAALAHSLDTEDFDLSAELLWAWPMLRLPWTPTATFALRVLSAAEDDGGGVLPGPDFDRAMYQCMAPDRQEDYLLSRSYHTAFVAGFLYAAALRPGCAPPAAVAAGSAASIPSELRQLVTQPDPPRWLRMFGELDLRRQGALSNLLLSVATHRARNRGDLNQLRDCVQVASAAGLLDRPAPRDAVRLLARSLTLSRPPLLWSTGELTLTSGVDRRSARPA